MAFASFIFGLAAIFGYMLLLLVFGSSTALYVASLACSCIAFAAGYAGLPGRVAQTGMIFGPLGIAFGVWLYVWITQ